MSQENKNSKEDSYNIYICGVGGQGTIKTSIIIGEAGMNDNLNVVMSEIHGMSQRGGVVSTELRVTNLKSSIISESSADLVLAFEPMEALRALEKINKNTSIIFNTSPIIPSNINQTAKEYPSLDYIESTLKKYSDNVYPIDAEKLALEAGHLLSVNMVLLGASTAIVDFPLEKESILNSMRNNLPPKSITINEIAFNKGYKIIRKLCGL